MERITFQTSDGVTIVGNWSVPLAATKAILLLHMMPATRVSWAPITKAINEGGCATLAIDLRGHGESVHQADKQLNYQNFSDLQHQASRLDIDAAMNFLKEKGFPEENISFIGASIGANLSLDAMYRYNGTRRGVLLSPGLDYRGVKIEPAMRGLGTDQKVWIVAAEVDDYSAESAKTLANLQPDGVTMTIYKGSDHGTNLFQSQPELIEEIMKFLKD